MKHLHYRIAALFLPVLFFAACNSSDGLKVKTDFANEIDAQQNLGFTFSKDIFPDSLLGRWDSTEYIEFTPKVRGSFRWNSSSQLVFSPAGGFEPGTDYTAVITNRVVSKSKKKYSIADKKFEFSTAPLRVANTHVSWTRGQGTAPVMVQLDVTFNYDIKLTDAASKIKLSSDGKQIVSTAIVEGVGKTVSFQFSPLNELDLETPLKIEVNKSIPLSNGKTINQKDTTINEIIPSRYTLTVTGVIAEHSGTEGTITVNMSQPVQEEGLKAAIKLEPSVPFDVTLTDAGFIISSEQLSHTQTYQLFISKKIDGSFGGKLKADYEEQVTFAQLQPSIAFVDGKGMYLSSKGFRNVALNIVNVPTVNLTVIKVYENNLEHFMRRGTDYDYYYDEDDYGYFNYYNTENVGDTVYTQTYETAKLPKMNAVSVLNLDFSDKLKNYDGVYVIVVSSKDHRWIQQSKILSFSDIGLIVKEDKDNMYVFANSIKNATPIDGVKINFISSTNQFMFSATTNSEGIAEFKGMSSKAPGFKVAMITAKKGEEFSFVWLSQSRVETSRFDVGGRMPNATNLNAMIYAERNLYRPGETIHASTVIRDESWNKPGEIPVKMRLLMPNGKEFNSYRKILNAEGSCEVSFDLPPTVMTGTYYLEVYTGNDVLLNSYNISVEDFMPDRLKVQLTTDRKEYKAGDSIGVTIQADNLFGTPAAGRYYECMFNLGKEDFKAKDYPDYNFAVKNEINVDYAVKTGKTTSNGSVHTGFSISKNLAYSGMLKGVVTCAVSDETGRPVHRYENVTIYTQPAFAGIKNIESYVNTRKPLKVTLVAVDKNGKPQNNIDARVVLLKKEWHTVIQQNGNGYRYVSQSDDKTIRTNNIKISSTGTSYMLTPELSGQYELRVYLGNSANYVSETFYAYGGWDTEYTSFEVNNEGNVTIKPDKDKYNVGDNINVLFTTPFEGRMLVTIERNSIMEHHLLETKNKAASFSLKAGNELVPNVYITATLFRPMDGSEMPLTVAHGFKPLFVENKSNHIPVQVNISEKSRSKTKQTITVKTQPNAYVTIAAVDEGILQVRNFQTPDAYDYFYQKVALATGSYDIYPLLLPEIKTRRSSTGGDGAALTDMRVNPMFVNRVKNVSFWSGILQANSSGVVKYDVDIPQFSGDLRVMAVAYKGKAFGGGDNHMKVADPIIISTALPRFMSPEDEVLMAITMSNTTAKDAQVTVSAKTNGHLNINGDASQSVSIKANSEQRVVFRVAAAKAIGSGFVTVTAKGLGETFTNETEMSVRPPASLQKEYTAGQVTATKPATIPLNNDFIPSTVRGKLVVSPSPLVQFTKNLSYLIRYPYGCVEQTTSAAFPQLYYRDLVKSISGKEDNNSNPAYNVQQAILKLQSMQMSNGALMYWPGGGYESWWGSVYACHFLTEARKAGYDVNNNTINRLLQYMKYKLNRKETEVLYYNQNMKKEIAAKEIAYSLYVLSLAGQPQHSTMNYYKAHKDMLSIDSKYMLAAAYGISGQQEKAKQVLPPSFGDEKSVKSTGGSFYSYIRDLSLSLNAMLEINSDNPQVGTLAKLLSEQLMQERYLNTQENAFAILAFGKIAEKANKTNGSTEVVTNGKVVANASGNTVTTDLKQLVNNSVQVRMKGNGSYYYFAEVSGISATGTVKEEDSYLRVRRTYYSREGKPITTNTFKQNDLIVVEISLEKLYNGTIDNIVITDMLPAGLEVENARLYEIPGAEWIKRKSEPDYLDIRDDRVNMFTNASDKPKVFYYMVRAVTPGTYKLGPVQADAMYNGVYHSYHGAGIVTVTE